LSRRILVVANEPPPLPGVTTTGPGLRAYTIARALQAASHEVLLVVSDFGDSLPQPVGDGLAAIRIDVRTILMSRLGELLELQKFDVVIFTNYIQYIHVIDKIEAGAFRATEFIYDFFAPKLLENRSNPRTTDATIQTEIALKQRALRVSSAILVNGSKKIPYVTAWLLASGADLNKPLIPANFAIDPLIGLPAKDFGKRHFESHPPKAIIAGHQQPWTANRLDVIRLLQVLADNRWELLSCGHPDIAGIFANPDLVSRFASLKVETFANLPYDSFCCQQASCDILLDVFSRTRERELAYVTRTAVALSHGLPAIHPRWTETGNIINDFGAGWLYESEEEIPAIIEWISNNPADLQIKADAAATLHQRQLNERCSASALCRYLDESPRLQIVTEIRKYPDGVGEPQTVTFLHGIFDPDWYALHFGCPLIDASESPADFYERHASAERSAPNFLLSHLKERRGLDDLRKMRVESVVSVLEGWLDITWLRKKLSLPEEIARKDIIVEYFRRARSASCDPNRFFSERFYLNFYPDVAGCVQLGAFVNGYDHYLSVGQANGYLPSPFFVPTPQARLPNEDDADATRLLFQNVVTEIERITKSPTPFFDPAFWQQMPAAGQRGDCLGHQLMRFIDLFSDPGIFGSAFHQEVVKTRIATDNTDALRTVRNKVLQQAAMTAPANLDDLRDRLDAHLERAMRDSAAKYDRFAWALNVLTAYQSVDGMDRHHA
jgi:hypothetical protein